MASNLPPGVTDAMIEDQAGPDLGDCQGNNCGDEAVDVGPDGVPYCKNCMKQFPVEPEEMALYSAPLPLDETGDTHAAPCKVHQWSVDRSWPEDPIILCSKCGELM